MNSLPARFEHGATPRLLDQVRGKIRAKHHGLRTEQAYADWIKRFIPYLGKRHSEDMSAKQIQGSLIRRGVVQRGASALIPAMQT